MADTARVTLAEIAAEAGVSLATMSKVLNGRTDVAPATRARLEEHLARHGYTRRNATQRTEFVELVFHELEPSWSMEVIEGVEDVAHAAGLSVVLTVSGDRHAPSAEWIDGVLRRRPVGVILVFSDIAPRYREKLRSRGIPFVIVDPAGDPSPDVPSVGSANWSGGLMATRHLIELGHRRIAAITGPEDMMCSLARVDGYRSAMNAAGLPIDPELIRFGDFHPGGGETHGRELLALPEPPTAIFAGSDLQALGVIAAGSAAGLSVPGRSVGRRLRRHRAVAMDEPAADDRPPAAAAHGRGGHPARAAPRGRRPASRRCAWISRRTSWCAAARRPSRPDRFRTARHPLVTSGSALGVSLRNFRASFVTFA